MTKNKDTANTGHLAMYYKQSAFVPCIAKYMIISYKACLKR